MCKQLKNIEPNHQSQINAPPVPFIIPQAKPTCACDDKWQLLLVLPDIYPESQGSYYQRE